MKTVKKIRDEVASKSEIKTIIKQDNSWENLSLENFEQEVEDAKETCRRKPQNSQEVR